MGSGRIHIVDEIEFHRGKRESFLAALEKSYRPLAESAGLRLRSLFLDPADETAGIPSRATLDFELGDHPADFWRWRIGGAAKPELAQFWRDTQALVAKRVRRYAREVASLESGELVRAGRGPSPEAASSGRASVAVGIDRRVAFLTLARGVSEAARADFERALAAAAESQPGCAAQSLGRNLPGCVNGGDYTFDFAVGPGAQGRSTSIASLVAGVAEPLRALVTGVDEVALDPIAGGLREPGIAGAVKRTLLLRVFPGTSPAVLAAFERDTLAMAQHIGAIRNWSLARVRPGSATGGWTHAWEQDFAELSGLSDDYMNDAIHWSVVDGWFHPEDPRWIVDTQLAHVFCRAPRSLLSVALVPAGN
jgi:hypothetical protein